MANTNSPAGLEPVRNADGSPWSGGLSIYHVSSGDSTALYVGDPVIITGEADAQGIPTVTRATAGTSARITGIVVGFRPTPSVVSNGYRVASVNGYALVAEGNDLAFEAQEDSAGGALTAASVGLNVNLASGSGSAATKRSGFTLDSSTANSSNTLQCRILRLIQRDDNEIGNYAKWLVRINLPTETGAAGSTGV